MIKKTGKKNYIRILYFQLFYFSLKKMKFFVILFIINLAACIDNNNSHCLWPFIEMLLNASLFQL